MSVEVERTVDAPMEAVCRSRSPATRSGKATDKTYRVDTAAARDFLDDFSPYGS
jgi:hypothetical protein